MGGSALRSIRSRYGSTVSIWAAGRSREKWERYSDKYGLSDVEFLPADVNAPDDLLDKLIAPFDLIIHTAGPFQQLRTPSLLLAACRGGHKYLDVCDDVQLSRICRQDDIQRMARKSGAKAIISTGIWPGVSSILAQRVVQAAGGAREVDKLTFSFHTSGSGGAGPTILTATFLILGEDALVYRDGKPEYLLSASDARYVDFGDQFGLREVVRMNLIECESCASTGIKNVETFFGTAPPIWNKLFVLMAQSIPKRFLQDRDLMSKFAEFSLPMVYLVDKLVGSKNGIRVDVVTTAGKKFMGLLTHADLEKSVGDSIASFASQMLDHGMNIPPGVHFPEEVPSASFGDSILKEVSRDAISYSISGV